MSKEQFHINQNEISRLQKECLFIVKIYLKGWFSCPNAVKAQNQDLNFSKDLIKFKDIDSKISHVTSQKFAKHLWYLSKELTAFAFFDNSVSIDIKLKMIESLKMKESVSKKKNVLKLIVIIWI